MRAINDGDHGYDHLAWSYRVLPGLPFLSQTSAYHPFVHEIALVLYPQKDTFDRDRRRRDAVRFRYLVYLSKIDLAW